MATVWDKIDRGLATLYAAYLRVRANAPGASDAADRPGVDGGKLHVELRYTGSLAPVEQAGFETTWTDGQGRATGSLRLQDLERIADRDEVVSIMYGRRHRPSLDKSVPQIRADKVWTYTDPGVFSGNTGSGVIVGVIDTGVDFRHPFMWARSIPDKKTRILRIWDQGLLKVAGDGQPAVGVLEAGSPGPYGVEYTDAQINDVLNGVVGAHPIRHRDCSAHGTHVASIAAGDGRFAFRRIGVAPRAQLIVVKHLYLENDPKVGAITVSELQQFKDAVTYIRKTAAALAPGTPVVINYSVGGSLGPHDGLTEDEIWLSDQFKAANAAGQIFVAAAGNEGGSRQHARIEFTPGHLTKDVPFELVDTRVALTESDSCTPKDNTQDLFVQFIYPKSAITLAASVRPPGVAAFTAAPALGAAVTSGVVAGHTFDLFHDTDRDTFSPGVLVERNDFTLQVNKKASALHVTGIYTVRLVASAPMVVHAWCYQYGDDQKFQLATAGLPAGVTDDNTAQINSPAGAANVIAVAAYNAEVGTLDVASFSSRGGLLRWSAVGGPGPPKPEIGAPGVDIDAANSSSAKPPQAGSTRQMSGTSMACPHVTGAIALMLVKKNTLTPAEAVAKLQAQALKVPAPNANEIGAGRLDAKATVDNTP